MELTKGTPRRPKPDSAQSQAFIDAARKLGGNDSRERFDVALKTVGRPIQRGKDAVLKRYGGFFPLETPKQRSVRMAEIDRLEADFQEGRVKGSDVERVQRRLCELKGINFDSYDDPND